MASPSADDLQLSDPEIDFDSPAPARHPPRAESRYTSDEARDEALRRELDQVRGVNKVIEGVIESLEKAKSNMQASSHPYAAQLPVSANTSALQTVDHTVNSASTLLQTWTRILSATEHNQRLILDPNWQGATQDLAEIEADTIAQRQAIERREREEQARREAAARRAEDDVRKRAEASSRPSSAASTRGRRGGLRGRGSASSTNTGRTTPGGYVGVGGQRGVGRGPAGGRTASGIGRGGMRGRGRG
ncbi:dash complex subunit duo1 [Diplodia corticola]|uniref:DASH complex subunit DUO1 n=1 Tax=Diplodia corticola TaxID=236234 RepID=A0A1J9REE3_9PEZI|nr:dash complex subunit duo1 [Diplodia corticola]OJD39886.1 dash complex subunit duo1 [Diplodia corticola]